MFSVQALIEGIRTEALKLDERPEWGYFWINDNTENYGDDRFPMSRITEPRYSGFWKFRKMSQPPRFIVDEMVIDLSIEDYNSIIEAIESLKRSKNTKRICAASEQLTKSLKRLGSTNHNPLEAP